MMLVLAITTRGASRWVLKMATGMPDWIASVSSFSRFIRDVDDGMVAFPVAGALADAAVDHQPLRRLGVLHVVFQHAQQAFLLPAFAAQRWARVGP